MKEQCPSLQPKETKEYADNQYWDDRCLLGWRMTTQIQEER